MKPVQWLVLFLFRPDILLLALIDWAKEFYWMYRIVTPTAWSIARVALYASINRRVDAALGRTTPASPSAAPKDMK